MKKMFITAVAAIAVMVSGLGADAQVRFGVLGGFTSAGTKAEDLKTSSVSLYHAGVAAKIPLGLGFAVQPQLTYQVKGTALKSESTLLSGNFDMTVGYVEVPVQVQWGPDLLAFRPYVLAEPFVGYAVNTKSVSAAKVAGLLEADKEYTSFEDLNLNRLEYGVGLGAGIEFWRVQLSARYFWNFGQLTAGDAGNLGDKLAEHAIEAISDGKSFSGFNVSLALFF